MTIENQSRENVDQEILRLRDRFGDFAIEHTTVENEPSYFIEGQKRAQQGWVGDAGAWVTDASNRVLLIRHEDTPNTWGTPGGGHEPDETLTETARREVREETGIDCSLTDVFWARRKIIVNKVNPDQRIHMLTVEFEGIYEAGSINISDDEVLEARWFTEPPDQFGDFLTEKINQWEQNR
ncbi:MAG: NUDIX hydrolase [Halobacteriaceae archaeon]